MSKGVVFSSNGSLQLRERLPMDVLRTTGRGLMGGVIKTQA